MKRGNPPTPRPLPCRGPDGYRLTRNERPLPDSAQAVSASRDDGREHAAPLRSRSCLPPPRHLTALLWLCALMTFLVPATRAQNKQVLFSKKSPLKHETWLRGSGHDDPKSVFRQSDRGVHISGAGYGYIATTRSYHNYHLTLQYRWGPQKDLNRGERKNKALDSGIFLHATGPHGNSHDGNGAFMAAIECNIMEGATGDVLLIRGDRHDGTLIAPRARVLAAERRDADGFPYWNGATGREVTLKTWGRINWIHKSPMWRDARGFRGPRDPEKKPGAWNTLECICRDDRITIILNGMTVNEISNVWPREGRILLQSEGAEITYRDIRLAPLPPPAKR